MPAYVVALIESISDPETYKTYVGQVEATLAPFGGRFLARKPDPEAFEGKAPSRAIVMEFPDEASARAWHASPGYQPVMRLRQSASKGSLLLLPAYPPSTAVREGAVCYVEHVTEDVEGTRALLEAVHGWRFAAPEADLGGSLVATLPGGARCGIRAPMHPEEKPITRSYVRVRDVAAASKQVEKLGAEVLLTPMQLGAQGTIDIYRIGGVEHGLWQLP